MKKCSKQVFFFLIVELQIAQYIFFFILCKDAQSVYNKLHCTCQLQVIACDH